MDFCTAHFGKTIFKVTLQDVEEFFTNERLETDQLEFKSPMEGIQIGVTWQQIIGL